MSLHLTKELLSSPSFLIVLLFLLMLITLFCLSWMYYEFLYRRCNKWSLIFTSLFASSLGFVMWIVASQNYVLSCLISLVLISLVLIQILKLRVPSCKGKKEIGTINGVKIFLCKTASDYINAWYNLREKTIYVSKRLEDVLSDGELKAVLKHELGHKNQKLSAFLRFLVFMSSLLIASFLVLVWFIVLFSPKLTIVYLELIPLFILVSISSSLVLWIEEHEADKHAVKSTKDLENFSAALIKVHTDRFSMNFRPFVNVDVKNLKTLMKLNPTEKYRFREFFKDFTYYFMRLLIFSVADLFHREIIITHPPTKFRILYLASSINENKGV